MKIFNSHIDRLEKDIALQEERFEDAQAHHVKTSKEQQEKLANFRDLLAASELQVKQLQKPPSQAEVLAQFARGAETLGPGFDYSQCVWHRCFHPYEFGPGH